MIDCVDKEKVFWELVVELVSKPKVDTADVSMDVSEMVLVDNGDNDVTAVELGVSVVGIWFVLAGVTIVDVDACEGKVVDGVSKVDVVVNGLVSVVEKDVDVA